MCGIVGIYYFDRGRTCPEPLLRRMADSMEHRGPDGSGYRFGAGYALGHRRLSIIDLAGGQQPLSNEDHSCWLVANGEMYNFGQLRPELEAAGHRFRTGSDCEIAVHGHEQWGADVVSRLEGMFAYALVDERSETLTLVRDRLGIKPLYYAEFDGALLFASEIKAILAYPGFVRRMNVAAASSYLNFRYVVGEQTFFEGVSQLAPGHRLIASRDGFRIERYWQIPADEDTLHLDDNRAIELTTEKLRAAVEQRMISDVPFGAYLSGGVDSSVVVAMMAQQQATPVKTYCTGFEEDGYNEFEYARMVADRYATDHREIVLSSDRYFELMPELIRYKDAPLGVPNEVALWQMSSVLKQDITVVLSGEGADELFGGYGRIFRAAEMFERNPSGHVLEFFLNQYSYFGAEALGTLTTREFQQSSTSSAYPLEVFSQAFDSVRALSVPRQFMWVFQRHHLPGLLQRLDTTTMATSVEGRVPFVDHRLVEFGQRLPIDQKLRWNSEADRLRGAKLTPAQISEVHDTPKWVLRQASKPLLPAPIIERKKVGFPVPLGKWLGGKLTDRARDVLLTPASRARGITNVDAVTSQLEQLEQSDASWNDGMRIWMLLSLEMFASEYFDGK